MINRLRWAASILTILSAISFSLIAYYDSHIRDIESSLQKKKDLHSKLSFEAIRALDEYNGFFLTRNHVELLEVHNTNQEKVNQRRIEMATQIKNAISILKKNHDVFKLSENQVDERLKTLSTHDELVKEFIGTLQYHLGYVNNLINEYTSETEIVSLQKSRKSTFYLWAVALNSIGLLGTILLGPVQRNPTSPPVRTKRR